MKLTHIILENMVYIKSEIINFITAGVRKKNFNLLIKSINKLLKNNIVKFHVTIIGFGYEKLKNSIESGDLKKYLTFTSRISYSLMYKFISKSDFFLLLLDPKKHKRYLKEKNIRKFSIIIWI